MDFLTFFHEFFTLKVILYGFILATLLFILGLFLHYLFHQKKMEQFLLENIGRKILPDFMEDANPTELEKFFKENGKEIEGFAEELDRADLFVTKSNIYLRLGLYYLWNRNFQKALEYFKKTKEINPKKGMANWAIGGALMSIGQYKEAVEYFKESIRLEKYVPDCYYNIGWCLDEIGEYEEAIKAYSKAYELDKSYWNKYNIACTLTKWGKFDKAIETLQEIINFEGVRELALNDPDFQKLKENEKISSLFFKLVK